MDSGCGHPSIPSETRISVTTQERLLGSMGVNRIARLLGGWKPLEPDGPPEPPYPPPLPVATPDLAFQVVPCLPDQVRAELHQQLRTLAIRVFPPLQMPANPEVRGACIDGVEHLAIWQQPFMSEQVDVARDQALRRLDLRREGESFASMVNSSLIRRIAQFRWEQTAKRLDSSGQPDPCGPIHLTGMRIEFVAPNSVSTRVSGYHEDPWPDVTFEVRVTDTIAVSGGLPDCRSESHIDVDKSWLHYVQLGVAYLFYFFLDAAWMFAGERFEIPGTPRPPRLGGAGCIGAALTPSQDIPLRGGNKVAFRYRRMEVSRGGVFGGGQALLIPREPAVWILGFAQWAADVDDTAVRAWYSLRTDDLRGAVQMIWTADGDVETPTEAGTFVTFDTEGAAVGTVLTKRISVRVADEDGLTAEATREVKIYVQDIEDDDVPPPCRAKPWLPVCEEHFRDEQ